MPSCPPFHRITIRSPRRLGAVALAGAALAGAVLTAASDPAVASPVDGPWQKAKPSKLGFDASRLKELAAVAERGKSNCLLVVRNGKIAGEWYFRGTRRDSAQDVFSVSKSVTSTLAGIARRDGLLDVSASASRWIPQWRGTPAEAVTVRHMLTNVSGRQWSVVGDYLGLMAARDRTAYAIRLDQSQPPGRQWIYNNAAIQTLEAVLSGAVGQPLEQFAAERLFKPLGMTSTRMTTDPAGNAMTFSGVRSTCRDLARLGQLMLNRGRWGRREIVTPTWVKAATGRSSTKLNAAYGLLWWLNRKGTIPAGLSATSLDAAGEPATRTGRLVPGAPAAMFWALGLGNQLIQVDPGTRTVVVRLGIREPRPKPPTFGPAEASRVVTEALVRR